ncbi:MAG: hypothetical protein RMM53_01680 [Bacteroidia bacterium]|nr:class I SAM-dependent methyltransferase [Bacteroidia bacterium]MDW8332903.1 hypothetical protein [Bacteroidia bacterium]
MWKKAIRSLFESFGIIASRSPYTLNTTFLPEKVRGHALSVKLQEPVDYDGSPLPWFTYPAIEYLSCLDLRDKKVFEWGSGNSSRWFAQHTKLVVSVERRAEWAQKIASYNLPNLAIVFEPDPMKTVEVIAQRPEAPFDVIVVDDMHRDLCCEIATQYLAETGLIIMDNLDQTELGVVQGAHFLRKKGFIQVDFFGFAPVVSFTSVTSFFFSRHFDFERLNEHAPVIPIGSSNCPRYLAMSKDPKNFR